LDWESLPRLEASLRSGEIVLDYSSHLGVTMCIICVEFQKQSITIREANHILTEMIPALSEEHIGEVIDMLKEADKERRAEAD